MTKAKLQQMLRAANAVDEESNAILYQGASEDQLAKLFRMRRDSVRGKLEGVVKPVGQRGNGPIYSIAEAAPYLVKPAYDIEAYIRKMHPYDLPKMVSKEFWAGQRAKQEYEFRAGDLWPTAKVVEEVGELVKLVKMSTQLCVDGVERQVELSEQQRKIIKSQMDGMLLDLHQRITERFGEPEYGIQESIDDEDL